MAKTLLGTKDIEMKNTGGRDLTEKDKHVNKCHNISLF